MDISQTENSSKDEKDKKKDFLARIIFICDMLKNIELDGCKLSSLENIYSKNKVDGVDELVHTDTKITFIDTQNNKKEMNIKQLMEEFSKYNSENSETEPAGITETLELVEK